MTELNHAKPAAEQPTPPRSLEFKVAHTIWFYQVVRSNVDSATIIEKIKGIVDYHRHFPVNEGPDLAEIYRRGSRRHGSSN
ncbi:MAG: hypothetical protein GXP10_01170 [Gammaproteobacteria bacterium]|nr:hypothetical protein [Gammaproteobacteria bacterium]